jgi:glycine/D-amino acid oxidase-like deaminating enzyme
MRPDILIVGQGLAGTMLAWELEQAGISFVIADRGHASAATSAAAGIINPITGRRLVKSWRIDVLLPAARAVYREIEAVLGVTLWRDMRVRRLFAEERERAVFAAKHAQRELEPFADGVDDTGFWIQGAARVDLPLLLDTSRLRWSAAGKLRDAAIDLRAEVADYATVIDCRGMAGTVRHSFGFVPWEFSKGELLELAVDDLAPDVVLNRRHWVVPIRAGVAWVGATHQAGICDSMPTDLARRQLESSAREILAGKLFEIIGQRAGVRVNLPDKRPVAGWHPEQPRLGLLNGLGGKGALWAPMLARQWVEHLRRGTPFDAEIDVARFTK